LYFTVYTNCDYCGCSSMVEPQPSKLKTRVRYPSPAFTIAAFTPLKTVVCEVEIEGNL
jgi:hypothetical protein